MKIDFIEPSFMNTEPKDLGDLTCNDFLNWLEPENGIIRFSGKSFATSNYIQKLDSKYNAFAKNHKISQMQNELLLNILFIIDQHIINTKYLNYYNEISIDYSEEEELIITRESRKGIGYILIDDEGDIMISFSGYEGHGWRKFIDFEEFNPHEVTNSLFSI